MKTAIFIPVRTGSTRLPNKALFKIKGKSIIEHLIDRVKLAKLPDEIVLCTTTSPDDEVLVEIAKRNGIKYFRGSEKDILGRFLGAAQKYGIDFIVCAEGDGVFYSPEHIDKMIDSFGKTGADNVWYSQLPFGASPFGIKVKALEKVCRLKEGGDTETGWGRYFTETGLFQVEDLEVEEELRRPEIRMALDYPEDYEFFKKIFDELYQQGEIISLRDVLALLESHPRIKEINEKAHEIDMKHFTEKSARIKLRKK